MFQNLYINFLTLSRLKYYIRNIFKTFNNFLFLIRMKKSSLYIRNNPMCLERIITFRWFGRIGISSTVPALWYVRYLKNPQQRIRCRKRSVSWRDCERSRRIASSYRIVSKAGQMPRRLWLFASNLCIIITTGYVVRISMVVRIAWLNNWSLHLWHNYNS